MKRILERIFEPWGKWELSEGNVHGTLTESTIHGETRSREVVCDIYKRVHKFSGSVQYHKVYK